MKASSIRLAWMVGVSITATLAAQHSPYLGLEGRALKALSAEQVEDYLEGRGMGLALAAELNGYPGPKHVLELAEELALDDGQLSEMREIFAHMQAEAVDLGRRIVERERSLDALFAEGRIDAETLRQATEDLGRLNGQLRGAHLAAHLATMEVLSGDQRARYAEARGYGEVVMHDPSRHHQGVSEGDGA